MTKVQQDLPPDGDRYYEGNAAILEIDIDTDLSKNQFTTSNVSFTLARYPGADVLIEKTDNSPDVVYADATNKILEVTITNGETDGFGTRDGYDYHYEVVVRPPSNDTDPATQAHVTSGAWTIHAASATYQL